MPSGTHAAISNTYGSIKQIHCKFKKKAQREISELKLSFTGVI